ncbi:mitochondrial import inner membrane translocase subunit Tim8 B-like [Sciurus carolinensis]|uniref:mitochondrial import inner membrane translocase subunit Tim8 B-like n=1 Tax=Sciurus carolinensis TaxID=30640 RepID=UPI001FB2BF3E|nr:mitochondrial import inner membrane translocase subunit Tim8 B-like [Sciurus carolinensis]
MGAGSGPGRNPWSSPLDPTGPVGGAGLGEADEAGVTALVAAGQQKAQFTTQVHHFVERGWHECVEKPGSRLDSGTENCPSTCVNRFIDTTLAIIRRFAQIVQKRGQ